MKTYSDLTSDQLTELAKLIIGDEYRSSKIAIDRNKDGVWINVGQYEIFLDETTGDINSTLLGHQQGVNNLWTVIRRCQEWGVCYGAEQVTQTTQ